MSKPEWGVKRICFNCGARFYDLQRADVSCPKCGTQYDPEAFLKSRRSRPSAAVPEKESAPIVLRDEVEADTEEAEELETETVEDEDPEAVDEEAEEVLEDTSELGEDDDDMAEVIENVDEDEEP